jgi:hypothetical protein
MNDTNWIPIYYATTPVSFLNLHSTPFSTWEYQCQPLSLTSNRIIGFPFRQNNLWERLQYSDDRVRDLHLGEILSQTLPGAPTEREISPADIFKFTSLPALGTKFICIGTKYILLSWAHVRRKYDELTLSHQNRTISLWTAPYWQKTGSNRFTIVQRNRGIETKTWCGKIGEGIRKRSDGAYLLSLITQARYGIFLIWSLFGIWPPSMTKAISCRNVSITFTWRIRSRLITEKRG